MDPAQLMAKTARFKMGGDRWAFVLDWIDLHRPSMKPDAPTSGSAIFRTRNDLGFLVYRWASRGLEMMIVVDQKDEGQAP